MSVRVTPSSHGATPAPHDHVIDDVTGLRAELDAAGGGGPHTHDIDDVAGLESALQNRVLDTDPRLTDARTPTSHGHGIVDVTNLQSSLDGKASVSHGHAIADTTGLQLALDGKAAAAHTHTSMSSIGTGSPSASNFLRGDGTWAVPAEGSTSKDDFYYRTTGATRNRWYVGGVANNATALTTGAPTINVLRAVPFIATRGGSLDQIGVQVTTAVANAVGRVGIYTNTSDTDLYPAALVAGSDVAQLTLSTTGMKVNTFASPIALTPNSLYWLVLNCGTAASTLRCLALGGALAILGLDNALGTAPGIGWSVAQTFAALPASFPAGATVISAAPVPAIGVRFSA